MKIIKILIFSFLLISLFSLVSCKKDVVIYDPIEEPDSEIQRDDNIELIYKLIYQKMEYNGLLNDFDKFVQNINQFNFSIYNNTLYYVNDSTGSIVYLMSIQELINKNWAKEVSLKDGIMFVTTEKINNFKLLSYRDFEPNNNLNEEIPSHQITFIVNGNIYKQLMVKENEYIPEVSDPYCENYTFKGWNYDRFSSLDYTKIKPLYDYILVARFSPITNDVYHTINYMYNDEIYYSDLVQDNTYLIDRYIPTINEDKKQFVRWEIPFEEFDFYHTKITKDLTFYPVFEDKPEQGFMISVTNNYYSRAIWLNYPFNITVADFLDKYQCNYKYCAVNEFFRDGYNGIKVKIDKEEVDPYTTMLKKNSSIYIVIPGSTSCLSAYNYGNTYLNINDINLVEDQETSFIFFLNKECNNYLVIRLATSYCFSLDEIYFREYYSGIVHELNYLNVVNENGITFYNADNQYYEKIFVVDLRKLNMPSNLGYEIVFKPKENFKISRLLINDLVYGRKEIETIKINVHYNPDEPLTYTTETFILGEYYDKNYGRIMDDGNRWVDFIYDNKNRRYYDNPIITSDITDLYYIYNK